MQLNKQRRERLVEILHNTATSCHDAVAGAWDKSDDGFDALKKAAEEGLEILHAPTPEYVTGEERSFETTVEVCAHHLYPAGFSFFALEGIGFNSTKQVWFIIQILKKKRPVSTTDVEQRFWFEFGHEFTTPPVTSVAASVPVAGYHTL